jgi:hypothetical protein
VVYQLICRALKDRSSRVRVVGLSQQSCGGIWHYVVGTVVLDVSKGRGIIPKTERHIPQDCLYIFFNNLKIAIYKNFKLFYLASLTVEDTR